MLSPAPIEDTTSLLRKPQIKTSTHITTQPWEALMCAHVCLPNMVMFCRWHSVSTTCHYVLVGVTNGVQSDHSNLNQHHNGRTALL